MNPVGELYSLPSQTVEGAPIPAAPLRHALSLPEAKRGEYCPVQTAEIKAASWEKRIDTPWGTFLRVQVENRLSGALPVPEIIDAWLRV